MAILLLLAYFRTKVPNFQVYGLELTAGQEVTFGWNPNIGHLISHQADEQSIVTLKLLPDTPPRIKLTQLDPSFLFGYGGKYLNVVLLSDGDRLNIRGKEIVFRQKFPIGFNWRVGFEVDGKPYEYKRAQNIMARKFVSPIWPVYSGSYLDLDKFIKNHAWKNPSSSTQLCVFRQSHTSNYFLTGSGLKEITINGNKPTYDLQFPAKGRLTWSQWDGSTRTDEISLDKSKEAVFLSFEKRRAVPLGETKEIRKKNEKILITNQRILGTNPRIYIPWLFPEQSLLGYIKLEHPEDVPGDFVYSNGSSEYACEYNQQLPSLSPNYKIRLAIARYPRSSFLGLFVCFVLIFVLNGYFWQRNDRLRESGGRGLAFYLLVETLLLVRFGFGLKAALQPPFEQEALSNSLFALLYVPYLIYLFTQGGRQWLIDGREWLLKCIWSWEALYTGWVLALLLFMQSMGYADQIGFVSVAGTYILACIFYFFIYAGGNSLVSILNSSRIRVIVGFLLFGFLLFILHMIGGGEAIYLAGLRIPLAPPAYFFILFVYVRLLFFMSKVTVTGLRSTLAFVLIGFVLAVILVGLEMFLSGDFGFFLYLFPLLPLLLVGTIQQDKLGSSLAVLIILFIAIMSLDVSSLEWQSTHDNSITDRLYQKIYIRHASFEELEQDPSVKAFTEYSSLRTMMFYSTRGILGEGYLKAPVRPILNEIGLNDMVYAVFCLAEHGALGGIALLAIYACLLWFGLGAIQKRLGNPQYLVHFILALGLLLTLGIVSYYIMAANVKVVSWTGRNMFFFGLNSYSDIWQSSFIVAIFMGLLCSNDDVRPNAQYAKITQTLRRWFLLPLVVILALIVAKRSLDKNLRESFKPEGYYNWVNGLIKQGKLTLKESQISTKGLTEEERKIRQRSFLEMDIKSFNNGNPTIFDVRQDARGKFHLVEIDPYQRLVASPFRERRSWKGTIRTIATDVDRYIQIGMNSFHLTPGSGRTIPGPDAYKEIPVTQAGEMTSAAFRFEIPVRGTTSWIDGFDVFAYGEDVAIRVRNPLSLNGIKLGRGATLRLDPGDMIMWDNGGNANVPAAALFAQGDTNLVRTKWENGRYTLSYPYGPSTAFVLPLQTALERSTDKENPMVTLTLDLSLNRRLTEILEQRERKRKFKSRREAITVMDALTGEVLSIAAWPTYDPNQPAALEALRRSLRDEDRKRYFMAKKNLNLTAHVMGSAHKPFLALAALHVRPKIQTLSIDHRAGIEFNQLFHYPLDPPFHSEGSGDVSWKDYLPRSNNLFHAFMATYALLDEEGSGSPPPAGNRPCVPPYRFEQAPWQTQCPPFPDTYIGDEEVSYLEKADLFKYYGKFFRKPLTLKGMGDNPYDTETWKPLFDEGLLDPQSEAIREILPERTNFELNLIQNVRTEWLPFLLGGYTCNWNNVEAAEAFSRLVTGNKVVARFTPLQPNQSPQPIEGMKPEYRKEILDRLKDVIFRPDGTAWNLFGKNLNQFLKDKPQYQNRLVIYAKTGTLSVDSQKDDSIFLLFMELKNSSEQQRKNALTTVIYLEQQGIGTSTELAWKIFPDLLNLLERRQIR